MVLKKSRISFSNFFYDNHHNGLTLTKAFKLKLDFPLNVYNNILHHGGFIYDNKFSKLLLREWVETRHSNQSVIFKEKKEFFYDESVLHQTSALIIGIWQVEAYFKDIKNKIWQEFTFNTPSDDKNKALESQIYNSNSISLHVRRGDYLTYRWSDSHKVIQDETYYINSINYLNKRIQNPTYFIFSDDIAWVKANLKIPNCTFVDYNNGKHSYIDMYLMSICKHNIIANSTFSWWGAWLNKNENKIVIAPERWLNSVESPGIFPNDWIKMEVDSNIGV